MNDRPLANAFWKSLALGASALLLTDVMAANPLADDIERAAARLEPKVVAWRRDIHQHPELGNRETRTAKLIADHLRGLGFEVRTDVAHTGVVGVLRGGKPGKVVALRAEMDGLPVTEQVDLPFASREKSTYNGQQVGVMHACGHDNHMAIMLGVAELLAGMKDRLPGTIKFIFQPAEEGPPEGEEGGAAMMVREGVLREPKPDAMFALHVWSKGNVGQISYRSGSIMAAADRFVMTIRGRQTHGALPWDGIDPIVVGAQVVLGLQTIASRQVDVTKAPSVITVGRFASGIRNNIVPDEAVLEGTIRTFDDAMQADIHQRIQRTAASIATSAGATAEVRIVPMYPVTYNDPQLTARMLPTLERVAGKNNVTVSTLVTGAEDFSFFQREVPGLYIFLGSNAPGVAPETSPANHSPLYAVDERVLPLGVRTMANLTADFLFGE